MCNEEINVYSSLCIIPVASSFLLQSRLFLLTVTSFPLEELDPSASLPSTLRSPPPPGPASPPSGESSATTLSLAVGRGVGELGGESDLGREGGTPNSSDVSSTSSSILTALPEAESSSSPVYRN